MNSYNIIIGFMSYKGGTNNLPVVKITCNYAIVKTFTGKTASKRANTFYNKLTKTNSYVQ